MKYCSLLTIKRSPLFLIVTFCFVLTIEVFSQTAIAPSGSGTSGSPYQIANLENLYWVTQNTSSWGAYFEQTADIDASSTSSWDDGDGGATEGFSPIGTSYANRFSGSYDGNGYSISGLTINRMGGEGIGMFGTVYAGDVLNVTLVDVDISCTTSS